MKLLTILLLTACAATPRSFTAGESTVETANGHYARNTSDATRDAHRQAVAQLRAGTPDAACATLESIEPSERRSFTEYLAVVCATRLPDRALSADEHAAAQATIDVEPGLRDAERDSLDQHRAWIAAVQDVLADKAKAEYNLNDPPLPPHLQGSTDVARLKAWKQRGIIFHGPTYEAAVKALQTPGLATQLALNNLLSQFTAQTASRILFADVSGMKLPARPPLVLPRDEDL